MALFEDGLYMEISRYADGLAEQLRKGKRIVRSRKGISQPGPIHKQKQPVFPANCSNLLHTTNREQTQGYGMDSYSMQAKGLIRPAFRQHTALLFNKIPEIFF